MAVLPPLFRLPFELREQIWLEAIARPPHQKNFVSNPAIWSAHGHFVNSKLYWRCKHDDDANFRTRTRYVLMETCMQIRLMQVCRMARDDVLEILLSRTHFEVVLGPASESSSNSGFNMSRKAWLAYRRLAYRSLRPAMRFITLMVQPGLNERAGDYERQVRSFLAKLDKTSSIRTIDLKLNLSRNASEADRSRVLTYFAPLHITDMERLTTEDSKRLTCPHPGSQRSERIERLEPDDRICATRGAEQRVHHSTPAGLVGNAVYEMCFYVAVLSILPIAVTFATWSRMKAKRMERQGYRIRRTSY